MATAGLGPSTGSCASLQGLPAPPRSNYPNKISACELQKKSQCNRKYRQCCYPRPFLLFCWEGWDVNAEGSFYMCQLLFQ